ncbi:MAG TPA: site-2 protease family protein [Polyangiaceae bacterium]|jgi:Zn-dependent protease|nr:site-2 protease family protein [Polyangiaceae bacterium]
MSLKFRIGKVPVEILPSFFVVAALLGYTPYEDLVKLALWVVIVLGSVTVHELGHALAGRMFGLEPRIVLHGAGGTTSWTTQRTLSTSRRIGISLAGPCAGFVLAFVVWAVSALAFRRTDGVRLPTDLVVFVVRQILYVNFWWGVLNLLPMLPLDGGNVMARLLDAATDGRGQRPALVISIALAAAIALAAGLAVLAFGATFLLWPTLLAVSFLASNWQELKRFDALQQRAT